MGAVILIEVVWQSWAALHGETPTISTRSTTSVIRVGIEIQAEPVTFVTAGGQPAGFAVELVKTIAQERKLKIEFIAGSWEQILADFKAGKIDLLANMAYTRERDSYAEFAVAHLLMQSGLFVRKGLKIKRPEELANYSIGVLAKSLSHDYVIKKGWDQHLVFTKSLSDALQRLSAGQCDAVIASQITVRKLLRDSNLTGIEQAQVELNDLNYELHMAVHKGDTELLSELNTGLMSARAKGAYERLYETWIGPLETPHLRWRELQPYLLPSFLILLAIALAFWRQHQLLLRLQRQTEALTLSEERLTLVVEGSQDAFWDWDIPSGNVERNHRWAEILGCKSEEIPPHINAFTQRTHPDDLEHAEESKRQILRDGHGRTEYRLKANDGSWRWIFDRGTVVGRDAAGRPLRLTGAASDITARKQTEDQLTRSQALLEQSQEAAQIGGWEYDLETRALYWTKQTYRIHDLVTEEASLTVDRALDFFTPTHHPVIASAMERAIEEGLPFDLELELVTAEKRLIWVRTIGRAKRIGNRVVRLHGSFQDITRRKKADEERQKLQLKMLEAQKLESLGVLAGGIAHDFNNLLTVIMGNASLAREDPTSSPDALDHIETAAHRAADLCRQMLAYAGKSRFSLELHDLNTVVEDTIQLLKLSISKNAAVDFTLAGHPLPIEGDSSQIRQVIMNLVINASDAIGSTPGRILVSTSVVNATQELLRDARLGNDSPEGVYVSCEIEDNGCGMSAGTMARIFDPFFTTKFTGRGLGLAAVLGIVRAHRGAFFVKSTLGKGSTFRMLLPRASAGAVPLSARNAPRAFSSIHSGGPVLVVDDEPEVRKIASAILERNGFSVTIASDGYEALALASVHGFRFKAVLLDMTMPGLDGPATLRELRVHSSCIPVLLMSGFSEMDARKHLFNDPLVAFLPKPFTAEDLLNRLQALLALRANGVSGGLMSEETPEKPPIGT